MPDTSLIDDDSAKVLKKTFTVVKTLQEERKSISEDIREEKIAASKKTEMTVKDINLVFKILMAREKGEYSEEYLKIAKAVEGVSSISS